ncbi:MAG: aromatic amino acid lyase, partial [Bacteroidales bacterium]|nr:aromatic amino acid lyase [Bacteroidales bacterium]
MDFKDIKELLLEGKTLKLTDEQRRKIEECHSFLADFAKDKVIYGINTGFGPRAQYRVSDTELNDLQYNIVRSHST